MVAQGNGSPKGFASKTGITFHSPLAFWLGSAALTVGFLLHLPSFSDAKAAHYALAGQPVTHLMLYGVGLVIGGLVLAAYGLFPRDVRAHGRQTEQHALRFHAMDSAPMTRKHWQLLTVLVVCLIIDTMKPATLGFVVPGMKAEYGLSDAVVALYPLAALIGLTIGSFVWGLLSDRLGRRASILLGGLMFVATAICGAMPNYKLNLVMCFMMGMAAGGFLPIVFALLGEILPSRNRSFMTVLIAGVGTAGGYLAASFFASILIPHFGWRPMWFLNAPTGLIVILLNRLIPESPRFLLESGRVEEAERVMADFGVVAERVEGEEAQAQIASHDPLHLRGISHLFRGGLLPVSIGMGAVGIAWGLVNFGFVLWLPKTLESFYHIDSGAVASLIKKSALIALPTSIVVAYLYGRWSSKKTMVLFGLLTSASLLTIAALGNTAVTHHELLIILVAGVLVAANGVIAMLTPYASEVYPTSIRGTGTGYAAGASKAGGIAGPYLVVGVAALSSGLAAAALVVAVPITLASAYLGWKGVETRGRSLEDIAASEIGTVPEPAPV